MSILFAISILAFCTLLWAAVAIARHIQTSDRVRQQDEPSVGAASPEGIVENKIPQRLNMRPSHSVSDQGSHAVRPSRLRDLAG